MSLRKFNIRQFTRYSGSDNQIDELRLELMRQGEWEPLEINQSTAGFLLFTYTLLSCQHMYMRANAAERTLLLDTAEGQILVGASEDWEITKIHVDFSASLRSGEPSQDDIDYITGRMKVCPVSKNIKSGADKQASLVFV